MKHIFTFLVLGSIVAGFMEHDLMSRGLSKQRKRKRIGPESQNSKKLTNNPSGPLSHQSMPVSLPPSGPASIPSHALETQLRLAPLPAMTLSEVVSLAQSQSLQRPRFSPAPPSPSQVPQPSSQALPSSAQALLPLSYAPLDFRIAPGQLKNTPELHKYTNSAEAWAERNAAMTTARQQHLDLNSTGSSKLKQADTREVNTTQHRPISEDQKNTRHKRST